MLPQRVLYLELNMYQDDMLVKPSAINIEADSINGTIFTLYVHK